MKNAIGLMLALAPYVHPDEAQKVFGILEAWPSDGTPQDAPPVEQPAPPEAVPVARDVPVVLPEQAPDTPRGRADVRMGRNKGRP